MSTWVNKFKRIITSLLSRYEVSGIKYEQSGVVYGGNVVPETPWSNQTKN